MNKIKDEMIKEIEVNFKSAIHNWADIILSLQSKGHNSELRFNQDDMMNITILFNEVAHNIAFYENGLKSTKESCARAEYFGSQMRDVIKYFCGFDTHEYYNK